MVTFEELVEKVARDVYNWKPRNKPFELLPVEFQRQYTKHSRFILATILEALSEPSEDMVAEMSEAMFEAHYGEDAKRIMFHRPTYDRLGKAALAAALAASPLVEEERKTARNENSGEND